jgi:hypothetical protein
MPRARRVPRAALTRLSPFFGLGTAVQAIPGPAPAGSLRHRLGFVAGCALLALAWATTVRRRTA